MAKPRFRNGHFRWDHTETAGHGVGTAEKPDSTLCVKHIWVCQDVRKPSPFTWGAQDIESVIAGESQSREKILRNLCPVSHETVPLVGRCPFRENLDQLTQRLHWENIPLDCWWILTHASPSQATPLSRVSTAQKKQEDSHYAWTRGRAEASQRHQEKKSDHRHSTGERPHTQDPN